MEQDYSPRLLSTTTIRSTDINVVHKNDFLRRRLGVGRIEMYSVTYAPETGRPLVKVAWGGNATLSHYVSSLTVVSADHSEMDKFEFSIPAQKTIATVNKYGLAYINPKTGEVSAVPAVITYNSKDKLRNALMLPDGQMIFLSNNQDQ